MSKLNNKKDANQYKKMLKNKLLKKWQKDKRNNAKIKVKAGENGKIFGGVTPKEISDNLKVNINLK